MFGKRLRQFCVVGCGIACCAGFAIGQALAQGGFAEKELAKIRQQGIGTGYSSGSLNQSTIRANYGRGAGRIGLGLGAYGGSKPFSNYSPGPTISPYMNLFREDFEGNSDLNYQTLVRPQLQQQQFNQQIQRQSMEASRRLQAIAAQSDFNAQGAKDQPPTGHQTVFMNYSHYYTMPRPQR